jgi:hypothetical protein
MLDLYRELPRFDRSIISFANYSESYDDSLRKVVEQRNQYQYN